MSIAGYRKYQSMPIYKRADKLAFWEVSASCFYLVLVTMKIILLIC